MQSSFKSMVKIPVELLAERIEFVKKLSETDTETYEIVKDKMTGEHYLHYCYMHLDIGGGGAEEMYYQLMPIENDDVLSLVFEEHNYSYPDHWQTPFLRNGPDDHYVWFSPEYAIDFEDSVKLGNEIQEKLLAFKKAGANDPESIKKLMDELDALRNNMKER